MQKNSYLKGIAISVFVGSATLLLSSCGEEPVEPTGPTPQAIARAAEMMPSDPALSQIYETTCKACHANPDTGAPLTGDSAAWEPRLAKGKDTLLNSTINGFRGMPPLGLCMDCTADEFDALIIFMSETE